MKFACSNCGHVIRVLRDVDQRECPWCRNIFSSDEVRRLVLSRRYSETILGLLAICVFTAAVVWLLLNSK